MEKRRKVPLPLRDRDIENMLGDMFSSEDENDEDEDPYLDYVPKSFVARLNDIQGLSNLQLLHILDDNARQSYEKLSRKEKSTPSPGLGTHSKVPAPAVNKEMAPSVPFSAPSSDLPAHSEMLAPAVDEEMAPSVPFSAPSPDLPALSEEIASAVDEEMASSVPFSAPSSVLPAHSEMLAPAVDEEMAPSVPFSAPSPDLPALSEEVASAGDEEMAPSVPFSAPSSDLPAHSEMLAPTLDEEIAPSVPFSAPSPDLPALSEEVASAVDEEMAPSVPSSSPSPGLHHVLPTYSELQARERNWTTNVQNFDEYHFSKEIKPSQSYSYRSLPIEYFSNLFPDEIFQMIVDYTNKYAGIKKSKFWKDTDVNEIKAFLAIIILMGINSQSDIELYWSADPFYNNVEISGTMTCKRFKKILENLHVCDITTHLPRNHKDHDKLQKVRPLLDYLNRTFQENATNSQSQSVDESMIKFKGRDSKKQYMPAKPIKRGYKAWCRCDAKTGYLYQFDIYAGKDQEVNEDGLGYRVVMKLGGNLPPNTHLVFDNFFSPVALMEALYHRGILATGTVRMNRKGLPKDLCPTKPKTPEERRLAKENKLSPGEFTYRFCHPCAVIKWQDTKEVFVLTTATNPTKVEVIQRTQKNGQKKDMFCPSAIAEYTRSMGGVDHFDHYRSSYSIGRKSKKSWFRIFWFLFESAIINAYILYKHKNPDRKNIHRDFRLRLARSLKSAHITNKKQNPVVYKNKKGGVFGVPDEIRLGQKGSHFLALSSYRRCRFCSTRKQEKRSKYECEVCKVALCFTPCMKLFHQASTRKQEKRSKYECEVCKLPYMLYALHEIVPPNSKPSFRIKIYF